MEQELIPGLPEEIGRECLVRVPYTHFPSARSVCKLWMQEFHSPLFHRTRQLTQLTRPILVLAQADPPLSSAGPARKYYLSSTPRYRLTTFDPASAVWHTLPPVPNGLPLFCQIAAVDRRIVVIGGWDPDTWAPSGAVHVFDFLTATWRRGASMPAPRRSFFACAASDSGRVVFVAGGHDEEKNALRSALAYDVAEDRWAPLPDMETERDECRGAFSGGRFHVIGGYPTERQGRFDDSAEAFDAGTWTWSPAEVGWLGDATCPRTCVAAGGDDAGRRVYMCRGGDVAVRDGGAWRAVAEVPEDASVAPMLVTWQGMLLLMGSGSHGGAQQGYVLELRNGRKAAWQKMEVPDEYSGHVQAACCLEI